MKLIPHRFLVRLAHPCRRQARMPLERGDDLLALPETCRLDNYAAIDAEKNFAEVRLAWNEGGIGLQVQVRGKDQPARGDVSRPRGSDGITLWIDTRDARTSHRASRYCHQFHLLAAGGGPERDEPAFLQTAIHRALQDAPLCPAGSVPFRGHSIPGGYRLEAYLPAAVLTGFDPDQNRRLGFYYAIQDAELGLQVLSVGADFPYWEDPSLWSVLELVE